MSKIRVNVISESGSVPGQGVDTAFREMVAGFKKIGGVKLLVNQHKPVDIIHIHTFGPKGLYFMLFGRGHKVVSAHVVPESLVGAIKGYKYWLPLMTWYMRKFYDHADAVIAVSNTTRQILLDEMKLKKPITVIEPTIDTSKYITNKTEKNRLRNKLGYSDKDFIIVGNGQVQPRKKVDDFVETARELPQFKFIWVGGIPFRKLGADYDKMTKMMKDVPENVRFTDVVPLSEAGEYMRLADVMFAPSSQETFGLSIVEGAACGLPVVVRDIKDYDYTFGENTIHAAPKDFAKTIEQLANDKKFYEKYQATAKLIAQKYDSVAGAKKFLALYKAILTKK